MRVRRRLGDQIASPFLIPLSEAGSGLRSSSVVPGFGNPKESSADKPEAPHEHKSVNIWLHTPGENLLVIGVPIAHKQ